MASKGFRSSALVPNNLLSGAITTDGECFETDCSKILISSESILARSEGNTNMVVAFKLVAAFRAISKA